MARKIILLIDDEKDFCELLQTHLEADGNLNVYVALDGKEGIQLANKLKPDLILLDVIMPGMDGFEVLNRLKQDKGLMQIPVIMLSAIDDKATKIKAAQLFDETYITKPIETSELKAKIYEVLKRRGD